MTLHNAVRWGFVSAAAVNILGMLSATQGFTKTAFFEADPAVFSPQGVVLVMVWGLAYLVTAARWQDQPLLCWVFALEKAVFVGAWLSWNQQHPAPPPGLDADVAQFMALYGLIDGAYLVFFATAAVLAHRHQAAQRSE